VITETTDSKGINWTSVTAMGIASVWLVHGVFNKLLHGSPRHLAIVQSVPGLAGSTGAHLLPVIALFEVAVAMWMLWGEAPYLCAMVQTTALLSMNVVELTYARPLLLWPAGLIPINVAFLSLSWWVAIVRRPPNLRARLRRHPIPIAARLKSSLTLTYAMPAAVLEPLLAPGLRLDTVDGLGFVAVALVDARSLRPEVCPRSLGQDFFLAGYRVFTTFRPSEGKHSMRGLNILRSDSNRTAMVAAGNLLTHYNYHRCEATLRTAADRVEVAVRTPEGACDVDVTATLSDGALPDGSPFRSLREARRFQGPLPFNFDYEPETDAIVAIEARRTNWRPIPVTIGTHRIAFFDDPIFKGCTPTLAAAFHVSEVEYHWRRGVLHPLQQNARARS
jgi:hypothetical protein